jgi:hypothetical protein
MVPSRTPAKLEFVDDLRRGLPHGAENHDMCAPCSEGRSDRSQKLPPLTPISSPAVIPARWFCR